MITINHIFNEVSATISRSVTLAAEIIVPTAMTQVINLSLSDPRIEHIVVGCGLIGSGIGCIHSSGVIQKVRSWNQENKETALTTTLRYSVATAGLTAIGFGISYVIDGVTKLITPPIDLNEPNAYPRVGGCLNWDDQWKLRTTNSSTHEDKDDPFSQIHVVGSQIMNRAGPCQPQKVLEYLQSRDTPFVEFIDPKKPFKEAFPQQYQSMLERGEWTDDDTLNGGACTAMTADLSLKIESECHPQEAQDPQQFINCAIEIAVDYNRENPIFRDRQCAFNSFTVDPKAPDPALAKIEALLTYHNAIVVQAIPEEPINKAKNTLCDEPLERLIIQINQAEPGSYFVRMIVPENNEKLEHMGHSLGLFKTKWGSFFYDPNKGLKGLSNQNLGEKVYQLLLENAERWRVSYPRLYRIACDGECIHLSQHSLNK
jgi:hypothetical protein